VIVELALFLAGLAILVWGASRAVTAAADLALHYGVSAFFIGVTVISVGTSVPEMTTSVYAALYGAGDLVVGNIVGSETSQITLALGVVAILAPFAARRRQILIYGGAMVLAMVIMVLTLEDGVIGRSEGLLMMLAYIAFVHDMYTSRGGEEITEEVLESEPPRRTVPWIVLGLALTVVGGHLLVTNGVTLARIVGVPEFLIGLLTGLGTTLPEITVAGIAATHGREDISVGSLLGSNITDPVFSLGVGALVADVTVVNAAAAAASMQYMLAVSLVVLGILYWREGAGRLEGAVCVMLYLPSFLVL
jgi:cation:H+ antiporter